MEPFDVSEKVEDHMRALDEVTERLVAALADAGTPVLRIDYDGREGRTMVGADDARLGRITTEWYGATTGFLKIRAYPDKPCLIGADALVQLRAEGWGRASDPPPEYHSEGCGCYPGSRA